MTVPPTPGLMTLAECEAFYKAVHRLGLMPEPDADGFAEAESIPELIEARLDDVRKVLNEKRNAAYAIIGRQAKATESGGPNTVPGDVFAECRRVQAATEVLEAAEELFARAFALTATAAQIIFARQQELEAIERDLKSKETPCPPRSS